VLPVVLPALTARELNTESRREASQFVSFFLLRSWSELDFPIEMHRKGLTRSGLYPATASEVEIESGDDPK
jgi:hypothetical protein